MKAEYPEFEEAIVLGRKARDLGNKLTDEESDALGTELMWTDRVVSMILVRYQEACVNGTLPETP